MSIWPRTWISPCCPGATSTPLASTIRCWKTPGSGIPKEPRRSIGSGVSGTSTMVCGPPVSVMPSKLGVRSVSLERRSGGNAWSIVPPRTLDRSRLAKSGWSAMA